jgi:hypothetical protein
MAYTLPAGVISESLEPGVMLSDFILWMQKEDELFDLMNAKAVETGDDWAAEYYVPPLHSDIDNAAKALLFTAMGDISKFLPEGHMFGWSDGKFGIFECRIKVIVTEAHSMPVARLKRLHRQFEIIEAAQKEIEMELHDIRDKGEEYRDAESVWVAVAAEMAYKMEAGNFSMGHVLRQITRAIARWR